jgi:CDP-glucose 4,6-dehydratase
MGEVLSGSTASLDAGRPLSVRFPDTVRPWQHVLDAVHGILFVAQRTVSSPPAPVTWNVSPLAGAVRTRA